MSLISNAYHGMISLCNQPIGSGVLNYRAATFWISAVAGGGLITMGAIFFSAAYSPCDDSCDDDFGMKSAGRNMMIAGAGLALPAAGILVEQVVCACLGIEAPNLCKSKREDEAQRAALLA